MTEEIVTSIEGWGLNNPDTNIFDLEETGEIDPEGPVMRLVILNDAMQLVGSYDETASNRRDPDDTISFYALPDGRYLRLTEPYYSYAHCDIVLENDLPDFNAIAEAKEAEEFSYQHPYPPLTDEERAASSERRQRKMLAAASADRPQRPPRPTRG